MNSFQLIRTNPQLTTNIKIVIDSGYTLYFESFDSDPTLSNNRYKHVMLNSGAVIENEFSSFYNGIPTNIAFSPKNLNDINIMYNSYDNQFDSTYFSGAQEVEDQWYDEQFEYFAPLFVKKNNLPVGFVILRVDDAAVYGLDGETSILGQLNNSNFRSEIIDNWKVVNLFDLTTNTNLGIFLDTNINQNKRFPNFSFYFNTKLYNNSIWSGMDYRTGVYTQSEMYIDDKLFYENPHFNLEKFITEGFQSNGIVYPFIWNLKFLFNDFPATPDAYNLYSINRYYGFYIDDLILVEGLTTYSLEPLSLTYTTPSNNTLPILLVNNIFVVAETTINTGSTYAVQTNYITINPFVNKSTTHGWVKINNNLYQISQVGNNTYKIIADISLSGYTTSDFNQDTCTISYNNTGADDGVYRNYVIPTSGSSSFRIDPYFNLNGNTGNTYGDLYLILIDGIYHVFKQGFNNDGSVYFYINSDYAITSNNKQLTYWKGGGTSSSGTTTSISGETAGVYVQKSIYNINDNTQQPLIYNVYRVNFSDIKDFDFDRIDTHYSDFDYEKSQYYNTPEIKLSANEYRDTSTPIKKKTYDLGTDGQYNQMIISSEYTAGDETFELQNNNLTELWYKNQIICKWGYVDSISHSDYIYKLNNNSAIGGVYNRTTNVDLNTSVIQEKTLDYFYRIGELYGKESSNLITSVNGAYWSGSTMNWSGNTSNPNNQYIFVNNESSTDPSTYYYTYTNGSLIATKSYSIQYTVQLYNNGGVVGVDTGSTFSTIPFVTTTGITTITAIAIALSNTFSFYANNASAKIYNIFITQIDYKYYLNQSTNIQTGGFSFYNIDNIYNKDKRFNLDYYIDSKFDYFDFFFNNIMTYQDNGILYTKPFTKYAVFNNGDTNLPASALFKGIEYKLFNINSLVINAPNSLGDETISAVNTNGGINYNGYKISVILSENYNYYLFDFDGTNYTNPVLTNIGQTNQSIQCTEYDFFNSQENKNGIHVFLNDKYKNILIIININLSINSEWYSLNNVGSFGENIGLYAGTTSDYKYNLFPTTGCTTTVYNPNLITAYNYMNALNNLNNTYNFDNNVIYHYIDPNGNYGYTTMTQFSNTGYTNISQQIPNYTVNYPPFYIEVNGSDPITLKNNSYIVTPVKGPNTNIYDKYLVYNNRQPLTQTYIDQPLARKIDINLVDNTTFIVHNGEQLTNTKTINRFIGYYEPVFNNIYVFKPPYYWNEGTIITGGTLISPSGTTTGQTLLFEYNSATTWVNSIPSGSTFLNDSDTSFTITDFNGAIFLEWTKPNGDIQTPSGLTWTNALLPIQRKIGYNIVVVVDNISQSNDFNFITYNSTYTAQNTYNLVQGTNYFTEGTEMNSNTFSVFYSYENNPMTIPAFIQISSIQIYDAFGEIITSGITTGISSITYTETQLGIPVDTTGLIFNCDFNNVVGYQYPDNFPMFNGLILDLDSYGNDPTIEEIQINQANGGMKFTCNFIPNIQLYTMSTIVNWCNPNTFYRIQFDILDHSISNKVGNNADIYFKISIGQQSVVINKGNDNPNLRYHYDIIMQDTIDTVGQVPLSLGFENPFGFFTYQNAWIVIDNLFLQTTTSTVASVNTSPLQPYLINSSVVYNSAITYSSEYYNSFTPIIKPAVYSKPVKNLTFYQYTGNTSFADNFEQFGLMNELIYSKVNESGSFLKLSNTTNDISCYPMVDEVGYSVLEHRNIFMSTWDANFFIETLNQQSLFQNYIFIPPTS